MPLGGEENQFFFDLSSSKLKDAADDHTGPRGDSRAAIGNTRCIGHFNLDLLEFDPHLGRNDLAKDRLSALADFSGAGENTHLSFRGDLETCLCLHFFFTAAGKCCAMKKEGKTDAPPF